MCQLGKHVWMMSACGSLIVVNATHHDIELILNKPEIATSKLVGMITIDTQVGVLALAYINGLVVFISTCQSYNLNSEIIKTSTVSVQPSQLYSIEVCRSNDDSVEMWCGCNLNTIKILMAPSHLSQPHLRATIDANTQYSYLGIPQDSSIIQLKFTSHSLSGIKYMYALHSFGNVISCWSTGKQPVLSTTIRLTQLGSPGRQLTFYLCDL